MTVLNIADELIDGIFSVVSAILHIGNLEFHDVDGESVALTSKDQQTVQKIAQLLGVSVQCCLPCARACVCVAVMLSVDFPMSFLTS